MVAYEDEIHPPGQEIIHAEVALNMLPVSVWKRGKKLKVGQSWPISPAMWSEKGVKNSSIYIYIYLCYWTFVFTAFPMVQVFFKEIDIRHSTSGGIQQIQQNNLVEKFRITEKLACISHNRNLSQKMYHHFFFTH